MRSTSSKTSYSANTKNDEGNDTESTAIVSIERYTGGPQLVYPCFETTSDGSKILKGGLFARQRPAAAATLSSSSLSEPLHNKLISETNTTTPPPPPTKNDSDDDNQSFILTLDLSSDDDDSISENENEKEEFLMLDLDLEEKEDEEERSPSASSSFVLELDLDLDLDDEDDELAAGLAGQQQISV